MMAMSPALSHTSSPYHSYARPSKHYQGHRPYHSRTMSESLLFTPPLSPTEEQLLAFLIPDIEPAELAAYLSAPPTPVLSDVSCLIGQDHALTKDQQTDPSHSNAEAVYPSPVCAAAAATVVAIDGLDAGPFPTLSSSPSNVRMESVVSLKKKRCSTYAFMGSEDEDEECPETPDVTSCPVFVMSSRNTRKRLMLEQAFKSPDEDDDMNQNCYAQLFHGASSDEIEAVSNDLSNTFAFDLVLA